MPFSPGVTCMGAMELLRAKCSSAARSAAAEAKRGLWGAFWEVLGAILGVGGDDGMMLEEFEKENYLADVSKSSRLTCLFVCHGCRMDPLREHFSQGYVIMSSHPERDKITSRRLLDRVWSEMERHMQEVLAGSKMDENWS